MGKRVCCFLLTTAGVIILSAKKWPLAGAGITVKGAEIDSVYLILFFFFWASFARGEFGTSSTTLS